MLAQLIVQFQQPEQALLETVAARPNDAIALVAPYA